MTHWNIIWLKRLRRRVPPSSTPPPTRFLCRRFYPFVSHFNESYSYPRLILPPLEALASTSHAVASRSWPFHHSQKTVALAEPIHAHSLTSHHRQKANACPTTVVWVIHYHFYCDIMRAPCGRPKTDYYYYYYYCFYPWVILFLDNGKLEKIYKEKNHSFFIDSKKNFFSDLIKS